MQRAEVRDPVADKLMRPPSYVGPMRRPPAAALALTALALAGAWAASAGGSPGDEARAGDDGHAGDGPAEAVPLALEVQASLIYDRRERACPGPGDCTEIAWRPNVQASALVPGTYEARARLQGTSVANACSFVPPASVSCSDATADARTHDYHVQVVAEAQEGGEVCRTVEARLYDAGVWVDTNTTRRCAPVPAPER